MITERRHRLKVNTSERGLKRKMMTETALQMINTITTGSDCNENDDVPWEIATQSTIKKQIIKK
jgi:hypothetical protein